jgi:hypothetical protein
MTNENKAASMDAVGEMYDMGNLLLREGGFPHLPNPVFVPEPKQSQSDAWNDAGTKPDHPCLCKIKIGQFELFQYWDGCIFTGGATSKREAMEARIFTSIFQDVQWREVQP